MGLVKHALGDWGPRLVALAAKDYFFEDPIKRAYFENFTNLVPMDRHGSLRESLRLASEVIKQGYILLIFPEGTRSTTGVMVDFKPSIGYLALANKVDVLPMYLDGHARRAAQGQRPAAARQREIAAHIGPLISLRRAQARDRGRAEGGRLSRGVAARRAGGAQAGAGGQHQPRAGGAVVDGQADRGERDDAGDGIVSQRAGSDGPQEDRQMVLVTGGTGFLGALGGRRAGRARRIACACSRAASRRRLRGARRRGGRRRRGARSRGQRRRCSAAFDGVSALSPPRRLRLARSRRRPAHDARAHRRHAPRARSGRRRPACAAWCWRRRRARSRCRRSPVDPRRARALPDRDRRRLALLPVEDLPGEAGARSRRHARARASSSSTRRCCSARATIAIRRPATCAASLQREIPVVPDGGVSFVDARDAAQGDRRRAWSTAAPASAISSAGPTGP